MKNRWSKLAGQLGIAYFLAGLFLVFLGWNGAATYDRVSAQVPYLISGGLAGLCLVVIGGSVLVAASAREGAAALEATVADLQEVVERMAAGTVSTGAPATGSTTAVVGSGTTTEVGSSSSGSSSEGIDGDEIDSDRSGSGAARASGRRDVGQRPVADAGQAATLGDDAVVTGPTSYHRPSCRLVEGQAGATTTTASEAAARGLTACRVCAPDVPARQDIPG